MNERKKTLLYRTNTEGILAQPTDIEEGELAININSVTPFLMFKNNLNEIEKIGSLTSSTGESEYHSMTQKSVTSLINKLKLSSGLNDELNYQKNDSAHFINLATSLSDADNKLDAAIYKKQDVLEAGTGITIKGNVISSNYDAKLTSGFTSDADYLGQSGYTDIVSGMTIDNAVKGLDENISHLVGEVIDNEKIIATTLTSFKDNVGLDENGKYSPSQSSNYIKSATSLSDADNKLDAQIKVNSDKISENSSKIELISSGGKIGVPVINHGVVDTTLEISPNVLHVWGEITELNITLSAIADNSIVNEYMIEFTSGLAPTTISLPSNLKWMNGESIVINPSMAYQISIINNLAVYQEFY